MGEGEEEGGEGGGEEEEAGGAPGEGKGSGVSTG